MNPQLLKTFMAVARTGSITRAAEDVGMTQPAASGQIRALEESLGKLLFERHARGVRLTAVGEELARSLGTHLDEVEAAFERLRTRSSKLFGTIYVGGPTEFMGARTPAILAGLVASGIDVRLRLGGRDRLYAWFAADEIDLGITASEPQDVALGFEPVFTERLWLVGPSKGPLALARPLDAASFANQPFVVYDESLPLIRSYAAAVFGTGLTVHASIVTPNLSIVRDPVIEGAGVSVLPDYLCEPAIKESQLKLLHRPEHDPVNRLFLVWRRAALRHPRTQFVRERFIAAFASQRCCAGPNLTGE